MNTERDSYLSKEAERRAEKQPYIDTSYVGIQARLLVGDRALNPRHNMDKITPEKRVNRMGRTIQEIGKVSYSERREYWSTQHKDKKFDERMDTWKSSFSGFINRKTASLEGSERERWIKVCRRFGLDEVGQKEIDKDTAQAFYDKYFLKKGNKYLSNTEKFARDGLGVYVEKGQLQHGGEEDMQETKKFIEEIGKWSLGNVSGAIMGLLTDARAAYEDPKTREIFFDAANRQETKRGKRRINRLESSERELLETFWDKLQEAKRMRIEAMRLTPPKKSKEKTIFERISLEPAPVKDDE